MADMQRAGMAGNASMRIPLSGNVQVGGKIMKELRFMPYSEFPEIGREETLYIDTDGNTLYYYDGAYIALSGGGGGGTGDYNELSNKPQINGNVLTGNKTAANLGLQETISDIDTIRSGAASGSTAVQPATLATALATKQDVISDLESIRSGASKGDTAVQPADMEAALSEKQDTISDLQTIRSGAALGATAVQPADMETALADKQDVIADLDAIREGSTAGNTALQPGDIDTLPTNGSSNPVSSGGTYNFVNSSIATNTAYFIGTFASVAELEAYTGTVTNNDYAFVTSTDSAGNTLYNRYKYNAAIQTWSFEYAVNNTSFTTAQWAAIQSGMTASDKTKLDGIEQGATKTIIDATPTSGSSNAVSSGGVYTALSAKQDAIADLSDIRSGASAGATAVQPSALNDYQTKLSGTNKLDPAYIEYDASHRAVSDTEKSTWNSKQDAISDLSTIRSGAAAGATALQQSDVTSTYSASGTAPVNGTAVNAAIGTLNKSSVGGAGKYISEISETNGKIAATLTNFDTSLSSSSTNSNAPTTKAVYSEINHAIDTAVKMICPNNTVKLDDTGLPSVLVYIPAFKNSDVLTGGDDNIHPAFIVNGVQIPGFYYSKYQNHVNNGVAYSLPAEDPTANITFDSAITRCTSKGAGWHLSTNAEWAAIALWCKKNGFLPYGNNNYGKDSRESNYRAIRTSTDSGKTGRVATGTGPLSWSHDQTPSGIWDMNGNVAEWQGGIRLVWGELQIIANNDAADPDNSQNVTSTCWRAINASTGALVTPERSPTNTTGTTSGNTVRLDYVSSKWKFVTSISSAANSSRGCDFVAVTADSTIGDAAKVLLRALALLPDSGAQEADYEGDTMYWNNGVAECCVSRGGSYRYGVTTGVFSLSGSYPRSYSVAPFGFRSAYIPEIG